MLPDRLEQLPRAAVLRALRRGSLALATGQFVFRIQTSIGHVANGLCELYGDFPASLTSEFADFQVHIRPPRSIRRYYRPQALFLLEGRSAFKPLAYHQAFPLLEWGMNWCISTQVRHLVLFHAAVVARGERALILPAPPGSGKSTLCAALASRGWRLLSDELAMLDPATGSLQGLARPVSLKNASIPVIREFAPQAHVSAPCHDTVKGTVAHLRPTTESVDRVSRPARPAWVVFPRFEPGADTSLTALEPGSALMGMIRNSFNYGALGSLAFESVTDMMTRVRSYEFIYSCLDEAVATFNALPRPEA